MGEKLILGTRVSQLQLKFGKEQISILMRNWNENNSKRSRSHRTVKFPELVTWATNVVVDAETHPVTAIALDTVTVAAPLSVRSPDWKRI